VAVEAVDLVVRNGWVVSESGRFLGGVAVRGERIVAVGPDDALPDAARTIDAAGQFIIPGLIDAHVHMSSEEDPTIADALEANLPVETDGMIHGGVTTFGTFIAAASDELVGAVNDSIAGLDRWSRVDSFGHAVVRDEETLDVIPEVWSRGVTSFKHFYNAYRRRGHEDPGLATLYRPVENDVLMRSMQLIQSLGQPGVAMVHAEDIDIISVAEAEVAATGRRDLKAWSDSRPSMAEFLRVGQAIELSRYTGCPLYVVHMSTREACAMVGEARRDGLQIWSEVGPHWLTHHSGMEDEIGCWGKVNAPLRSPADNEALWRGFHADAVTCLGTDHGTGGRTRETKEKGGGKHDNIWAARPGIKGGSEHMLPAMMTYGVHTGRISMEDLVRTGAATTARVFGLYPRKGVLAPGADADIVIVDPERTATVDDDFYRGLCEVSIYDGHQFRGMARTTIVRGRVQMEDYETVLEPGDGRYQPRGDAARDWPATSA